MKILCYAAVLLSLFMDSCESTNRVSHPPVRRPAPPVSRTGSPSSPALQTETEYQALIKTYKPETAAVLTDILNGGSADPDKTSVTVENKSRCNMVLTISGNNYFRKVPIGAGKIGAVMVPNNQNYNLSGMVCDAVYQKARFIAGPQRLSVSN